MVYNIITVEERKYKDFESKFYLHVVNYPYVIQISKSMYDMLKKSNMETISIPIQCMHVCRYDGHIYFKADIEN